MSDSVICDVCRRPGRRIGGASAPEGWYFVELQDDQTLEVAVIYACSETCTRLPWKRGPGRLSEGPQPGIHVSLQATLLATAGVYDAVVERNRSTCRVRDGIPPLTVRVRYTGDARRVDVEAVARDLVQATDGLIVEAAVQS